MTFSKRPDCDTEQQLWALTSKGIMSGMESSKAFVNSKNIGIIPVLPNSTAKWGKSVRFTVKPANTFRMFWACSSSSTAISSSESWGDFTTHILIQQFWTMKQWKILHLKIGLMVGMFDFRTSSLGSSAGWSHWVMFLGKTLYSHSVSLKPRV